MKVILRDDMDNLGNFGDVVKVAPGYARNFLIPQGLAVAATPGNIKQLETEKEAWRKKSAKLKEDAEKLRTDVEALSLEFSRKAGEEDRLFGSVTSMDIEAALKAKGYKIDRKSILLGESIKSLGASKVTVRLHPEVKAEVTVSVVRE